MICGTVTDFVSERIVYKRTTKVDFGPLPYLASEEIERKEHTKMVLGAVNIL